jgi:hypothetical protein
MSWHLYRAWMALLSVIYYFSLWLLLLPVQLVLLPFKRRDQE